MLSFLKRNIVWMFLSLALSTGLWLVVTVDQNPQESNWFPSIPIELVDVPSGLASRAPIAPVKILVTAPRDLWASRSLPADRFKATVNASTAGPGIVEVPISVTSLDPRAKVEEVDPPKATLRLEPIRRKDVPVIVRVSGSAPLGYETRQPRVTPAEITVSGPQSLVESVNSLIVEVNLEGARTSVSQAYSVVPRDDAGNPVEGLVLSAEKVLVEVLIVQEMGYKTISVQPQVVGTVAFGYQIVGVVTDPSTTTVAGDPAALADMNFLGTRPIDISGATGDVAVSVEPALPDGVSLARAQPLLVRILVSPIESSKTLEIAPVIKGGGDRLISVTPGAVQVTVSGPMPILTKLKPQDVQVTVDATGLPLGAHIVKSTVTLVPLIKLVGTQPTEITITIR